MKIERKRRSDEDGAEKKALNIERTRKSDEEPANKKE
jgi:hypothetical protein